jgi:hypothetical protein
MKFAIFQWVYVAIVAPLLGVIGGWGHSWWTERRSAKRRKKSIIAILSGLPPESKAVLIHFYKNGAHTRRADPSLPAIRVLESAGILTVGPGGGTYDAVDRYLTVRAQIWELMEDWIKSDISIGAVVEEFFEPVTHDASQ